MSRHFAVTILAVTALMAEGCMVSKTKYEQATAESERLNAEIEKTKAHKTALSLAL